MDLASPEFLHALRDEDFVCIAAAQKKNLTLLKTRCTACIATGQSKEVATPVVNIRHYESLNKSKEALENVLRGIKSKLSHELLAQEVRIALHHLGEITGEVTTDELLHHLFAKFCIGK